jgi:molybdopterin-guanine dinucleotide biosynthesis protein
MILVVGGHSRNVGKTSVVCSLLQALPGKWTAIKITQFGHGVCSSSGADCECATDPDHPFAITCETHRDSGTDTSRYLDAGAADSLWLRTRAGELGFAVPALRRMIDRATDVIIESNSVIQYLKPDAYLTVIDPRVEDFKASSRLYLDRADAIVFSAPAGNGNSIWSTNRILAHKPRFLLEPGFQIPADLIAFVSNCGTLARL